MSQIPLTDQERDVVVERLIVIDQHIAAARDSSIDGDLRGVLVALREAKMGTDTLFKDLFQSFTRKIVQSGRVQTGWDDPDVREFMRQMNG